MSLSHKLVLDKATSLKTLRNYVFKLVMALLLKHGNKMKMHGRMDYLMKFLKEQLKKKQPVHVIFLAVSNLRPPLKFILRRKGARAIKIPSFVPLAKSYAYAARLLFESAEQGTSAVFEENLALEIINASRRSGVAYKKKEALCKEYMDNKANIRLLR